MKVYVKVDVKVGKEEDIEVDSEVDNEGDIMEDLVGESKKIQLRVVGLKSSLKKLDTGGLKTCSNYYARWRESQF